MIGGILDAGGTMANTTLPEKSGAFDKPTQDNLLQGVSGEDLLWDENDKLVPEAQTYSESKTILKANHPLMIMVKEKKVVSKIRNCCKRSLITHQFTLISFENITFLHYRTC